jgi:uncharacterized damage-inducible protein DinB
MRPSYPPIEGSEREQLEQRLDRARSYAIHKFEDLEWDLAIKRLSSSPTSMAGLLKHLVKVEHFWFKFNFLGEELSSTFGAGGPDADFEILSDDNLEKLIEDYNFACQESRSISKDFYLEDQAKRTRSNGDSPSLRWIYLHLIEEIAQHNGHLDIYRELLDGRTD